MRSETTVADLLRAPSDQRLTQLQLAGLTDVDDVEHLLTEARARVHHDPSNSDALARLALAVAADHGWPHLCAQAEYLLAQVHTERGEFEVGLTLIDAARRSWLEADEPVAALRTDLGRMQILDDIGRHRDALSVGQKLLAALDDASTDVDQDLVREIRAHALDNLGTAYGYLGKHERALQSYAAAEAQYRALGLLAEACRPRANRGVELLALGQAREARVDLAAAIEGFTAAGDELFAAKCSGFLAQAHQQLGEFFEALEVLTAARRTLDSLGAATEAVRLQLAVAETYLAIGGWPEARHEASDAAATTVASGMVHDNALAHYLLALAGLGAGDLDAAEQALSLAEAGFAEVHDQQYTARIRLTRANVAAGQGQISQAQRLAEQAEVELAAGGWLVPLAGAHLLLADLAGDTQDGSDHLDRAGAVVSEIGLPQLRSQYHVRAARRARSQGDLDAAERLLRLATDDLGLTAQGLLDHALRSAFRAERFVAFDELITVLLDRGRPEDDAEARAVSSAAKAATLQDLLTSSVGVGPRFDGSGSALAEAYTDLGATYQALQGAPDAEHQQLLTQRMDHLEERVSALRLRQPAVARTDPPHAVDPARTTPSAAVTYEYHVSGDDVVLFVSSATGERTYRRRGAVSAVSGLLDQLEDQWARFQVTHGFSQRHQDVLLETSRSVLAALSALLLEPADAVRPVPSELHIVPHGLLGRVPFAALLDGRSHLVEHSAVTLCPTAAVPAAHKVRYADALVVGVSDPSVPATATEAAQVAERLGDATVLLGTQATAAAFLAEAPGRGLVHLACHGVFRDANPLFSRLRLADRWVTASEILQLDLGGALVVLSACESGQLGRSAEPVGLSWAFLAAGASGVVASHCVVDDASTAHLMSRFHDGLASGDAPASALRTAQIAVAATQPHPFHWSSFSYVARPGPTSRSYA